MSTPELTPRLKEFLEELRQHQFPFTECSTVEINTRGSTGDAPLKIAVVRQDVRIVRDLLVAGADPNIQGEDDCTPLHHAAGGESVEIVQLLLAHGASKAIKDYQGDTPIEYAVFSEEIREFLSGKRA